MRLVTTVGERLPAGRTFLVEPWIIRALEPEAPSKKNATSEAGRVQFSNDGSETARLSLRPL
jgi:hypothetical protein